MKAILAMVAILAATMSAQIQYPDVYVLGSTAAPGWGSGVSQGRWDGDMVHFPAQNRTLLFGGSRFEAGGVLRSTNAYHVRDGVTGAWTDTLTGVPINQRSAFRMLLCPLDGHAYLMGGDWLTGAGVNRLASTYRVSMSAGGGVTFALVAPCPVPIANYGAVWYPDAGVFLLAGGDAAGNITADVRVFNPDLGGTWGVLPGAIVDSAGAPFPVRVPSLTIIGSELFLCGGLDASGAAVSGLWKFNPLSLKFQPISGNPSNVFGDLMAGPFSLFGAALPGACRSNEFPPMRARQLVSTGFVGLNLTGNPSQPGHRFQPFGCPIGDGKYLVVSGRLPSPGIACSAGQWDVANDAWLLVLP